MSKKILITGAGGFVGSFLVEEALAKGYEVYAGVRKSTNLQYLRDERIKFVTLNFEKEGLLAKEIEEFCSVNGKWDYVVHNMGVTKTLNCENFDKINYVYLKNFVSALIKVQAVPAKFVYMSSLSAWKSDTKGYSSIDELAAPCPSSYYGKSKLRGEYYLRTLKNFPYVVMRPTGVYGPREKDYFEMLKLIKMGVDISVGFKEQRLTFIYVRDLVKAVFLALEKGKEGEGYFLTDGKEYYTQKDFRRYAAEALGKRFVISISVPLALCKFICSKMEFFSRGRDVPVLNKDKFNILKQRCWTCDISKAKEQLGYAPEYDLKRGLQECIAWYKDNGWL